MFNSLPPVFQRKKPLAAIALLAVVCTPTAPLAFAGSSENAKTTTPIKHLVVIFQENVSFDHYFGTYPFAANSAGEPSFQHRKGTPGVNGLTRALLNHNPNQHNPFRLDRSHK